MNGIGDIEPYLFRKPSQICSQAIRRAHAGPLKRDNWRKERRRLQAPGYTQDKRNGNTGERQIYGERPQDLRQLPR